jgi:hypothetical protein
MWGRSASNFVMRRIPVRWTLPVANAAVDAVLLGVLAWRPLPLPPETMPPELSLIAAGTLPAGVVTWTLLQRAAERWIWLHEGLALLVWYGIGAWADRGRSGARRVCRLYLMVRAVTVMVAAAPAEAQFASLVLALAWLAGVFVMARQWIAGLALRGERP